MESHVCATFCVLAVLVPMVTGFWNKPRGPQMYPCLTYLEKYLRVDCEFPPTYQLPGPYCEYKQDSRLVGSTVPNAVALITTEDRRRANVSLVSPTLCRLTWAPLTDERAYTYTCRVYQGTSWKENSMSLHERIVLVCSAFSVIFQKGPWLLSIVMSLPVAVGLLSA